MTEKEFAIRLSNNHSHRSVTATHNVMLLWICDSPQKYAYSVFTVKHSYVADA